MIKIWGHRRFTANHTLNLDLPGHHLLVKLNPNRREADAEAAGHTRIRDHYPVPALRARMRLGGWTAHVYDRFDDRHLLLDEITRADETGDTSRLDRCLNAVFGHYRTVIEATASRVPLSATVDKLFGERARVGGRLDRYYLHHPVLRVGPDDVLDAAELAQTTLIVNGTPHILDLAQIIADLRNRLHPDRVEWTAITQGDPTDLNIGWTPESGPIWFDYDTGGRNALAGEFACFLVYQRLHGGWIVPTHNPAAFTDHPAALRTRAANAPLVRVRRTGPASVAIDCRHEPSPARQHTIDRYLREVVAPVASTILGVDDLTTWLRPWMIMRLLAVYHLGELTPTNSALHWAHLAQLLYPGTSQPAPVLAKGEIV